jgi:DNA-binding transcriptional MerR regulator
MADEPLLTLRQTAEQLGLPESTVRFYRDAFLDHVPFVGSGRRRRYPPAAVAVLRSVADGYAAGRSRDAIRAELDGSGGPHGTTAGGHGRAEVSNLEILAAIVDGEREQRDALWQMAREIVRLTDVLEGQERLLGRIADQAALPRESAAPMALGSGDAAPSWLDEPLPPPAPFVSVVTDPPGPAGAPAPSASAAAPERAGKAPPAAAGPDLARLQEELERERELVERLRQARLQLEHRVADAEAELEERRGRTLGSVLDRILKPGAGG